MYDVRRASPFCEPPFVLFDVTSPSPAMADIPSLRNWLKTWLRWHGIVVDTPTWQVVDRWNIARHAQLTYPLCRSPESARLACSWLAWWYSFDDVFDQPMTPAETDARLRPFLEQTRAARTMRRGGMRHPCPHLSAFAELNLWTLAPMTSTWRDRWCDDLERYLIAYAAEARRKASREPPRPAVLIRHKRDCMAQQCAANLVERVETGELSAASWTIVAPTVDAVSDVLGAINDLCSLAKERACGDVHNLVLAHMWHDGLDEESAEKVVRRFVGDSCVRLKRQLQTIADRLADHPERQRVIDWLATCEHWVGGYHDWAWETGRFAAVQSRFMQTAHNSAWHTGD